MNQKPNISAKASTSLNSVSGGFQNTFNANYSEKKWALRLNVLRSDHGNYRGGHNTLVENSQYSKTNLGLSAKVKLTKCDFVSFDLIADEAKDVGYPALPMDVAYARAAIYSLTYKKYLKGPLASVKTKVYGNDIQHLMDDSKRHVVMHMDMPGWSDTRGAYILLDSRRQSGHKFSLNLDAYANRSLAEMTMYPEDSKAMYMLTWPDIRRRSMGLYFADEFKPGKNNVYTFTFRSEWLQSMVYDDLGVKQLEVFGYSVDRPIGNQALNSSFSYSHTFKGNHCLEASAVYGERMMTVSEQFAYYIFNSKDAYDYIGNPFIRKERSAKAELTYCWKSRNFQVDQSFYAQHMPDYILGLVDPALDGMTWGSKGVKVYRNLPYADLWGFEFQMESRLNKALSLTTSFTYTHAVDDQSIPLPLIPPLKNRTGLKLKKAFQEFFIECVSAATQNSYRPSEGETRSPAYAVANFRYSRRIPVKKNELEFLTGVNNIFDTYYYDHLDWNSIPRPGRDIFLKLRFNYN